MNAPESKTTPAGPPATSAPKLVYVSGTVKAISEASLALETKAGEYTFDLRGAAIRIGVQAATAAHLKEGDEVCVAYVRADELLVAKTVNWLVKRVT